MGVRRWSRGQLAGQLANPSGPVGRVLLRHLDRVNEQEVSAAVAAAELGPGEAAADLGFGGGIGLVALLGRVAPTGNVVGVEPSRTALAAARRRHRAALRDGRLVLSPGELTALPIPDRTLDAAITVNTVYFVERLADAAAEVLRTLRPGGRLVVGVGDPEQMREIPFTAHGFRLRPVDALLAVLTQAGFEAVTDRRLRGPDGAFHLLVARRPSA